jgi:hypothetical protein
VIPLSNANCITFFHFCFRRRCFIRASPGPLLEPGGLVGGEGGPGQGTRRGEQTFSQSFGHETDPQILAAPLRKSQSANAELAERSGRKRKLICTIYVIIFAL